MELRVAVSRVVQAILNPALSSLDANNCDLHADGGDLSTVGRFDFDLGSGPLSGLITGTQRRNFFVGGLRGLGPGGSPDPA